MRDIRLYKKKTIFNLLKKLKYVLEPISIFEDSEKQIFKKLNLSFIFSKNSK